MECRLLSYNVHGCLVRGGRRDPERIASVLRETGADTVALQEVYSGAGGDGKTAQLARLAERTGLEAVFAPTLERDGLSFGNALLTSWPVVEVRRYDLSVDSREPRGALEATLEIGDAQLSLVVTHLGLRARERVRQVQRLFSALDNRVRPPFVLAGDVNEWNPFARTLRLIGARFGRSPALATFPAFRPALALDRIWAVPVEMMVELTVVRTSLARSSSDHLPILATLRWPGTAQSRVDASWSTP